MKGQLKDIGRRASAHATALSRQARLDLLREAAAPWGGEVVGTIWTGGKYDTTDGVPFIDTVPSFATTLAEHASNVLPKGTGSWFTPALSKNGRCRDEDIDGITLLSFDADNVGEWDVLLTELESIGLSYVAQRSSSHEPGRPKFHVHLPLTAWWYGDKAEWRPMYRHCVAWFSVAAELDSDLDIPLYGFDLSTDRLGQPWFLSARRSEWQSPPATRYALGAALDLERFLLLSGFQPHPIPLAKAGRRRGRSPEKPTGEPDGVLARAFDLAAWRGPRQEDGKHRVLCPWRHLHTSGRDFDGSTVIFPPRKGADAGVFHCSHQHCAHRTRWDVFRALPPECLQAAITPERREGGR